MKIKKAMDPLDIVSLSKATSYRRPNMRAADSLIGVSLSGARGGSGTGRREIVTLYLR
jgi:hypothetical protein